LVLILLSNRCKGGLVPLHAAGSQLQPAQIPQIRLLKVLFGVGTLLLALQYEAGEGKLKAFEPCNTPGHLVVCQVLNNGQSI